MSITEEQAAGWFTERARNTPMPGMKEMFRVAAAALRKRTPTMVTHEASIYSCHTCPSCKNVVDETTEFVQGQKIRVQGQWCKFCGQALKWDEQKMNLTLHQAPNFSQLAAEKIAAELKEFKGDRYGNAVKNHVASTITHFCEQNERFAEVVYKTKRTLSDCCAEIMKGCGQSISDIDVYRGAVRNYFPNADIDFHMTITLTGDAPTAEEMSRMPEQKPAPKAERKTEVKKPAQTEKTAQPTPAAPAPTKPVTPPTMTQPQKKTKGAYEDTNVIQLTLF